MVVPVSFVSEHIETLEEIDMEYRELAVKAGIQEWRRVPALNTDLGFIQVDLTLTITLSLTLTLTLNDNYCSPNNPTHSDYP